MPYKQPTYLISEITKRGLIAPEVISIAETEAVEENKDLGQILVEKEAIDDDNLAKLKSEIYQLPIVNLPSVEVKKEVAQLISADVMEFYQIIPFAIEGDILKVAIVNPEDIDALEALKFIAAEKELTTEKYIITYKDFENLKRNLRPLSREVGKALESFSQETSKKELELEKGGGLDEITVDAPVSRIVAAIVKHAVDTRASDIHVEPFEESVRLRFRIDGVMQIMLSLPKNLLAPVVTRIKILSEMKIDETRIPQDGRFSTALGDRKIDFRVSTIPTRNGEKTVMRILDPLVGDINLTELGLEGRSLKLVRENINKPFGSILITGPTGSGKSTTLAAILREINDEGINIITLENPIEYYVEGVNQSQIHEEVGYTFASGLRHILRQDPDIIMVGEIRDGETANLAIQSALTGHLVLSTLHTNDTIGIIPRLVNMGVEPYLVAPTLNIGLAQRLLRKLCDQCKAETKATSSEAEIIKRALKNMPEDEKKDLQQDNFKIYKAGEGCKECGGKAYKGRIAIFETLEMTDQLEKIILGKISEQAFREEAKRQGMISVFQDGIRKVLHGVSSLEELFTVAQEGQESSDKNEKEITKNNIN
ncbi:MAG: hypothetical protein COV29_03975 [Candidatus Yanofskybacteria bacterium CG10_big_fil_rev_8_21_14_0_10_36_16]|uniref:Bacterial type II secretion system protein E domain-containing protein n=1 Tax=Candidatus Yanofskybacteria bacterium CG10_big_fil_rev_8_21_14_0_10_36_16 TaxID=1975096 RepID=A0A2J0Q6P3_9BACT|nr:MAG: hypothetical protein COV29_03975 [Candidatus Yanofskybacteria bacterium CG10_big_fil_rev_8_21_14_0_10_36_16]